MDISSLKTPTLPITLLMIKWAIDALTPDDWTPVPDGNPNSMPIDAEPVEIPTIPNQPSI
jgi:hypothetical protein